MRAVSALATPGTGIAARAVSNDRNRFFVDDIELPRLAQGGVPSDGWTHRWAQFISRSTLGSAWLHVRADARPCTSRCGYFDHRLGTVVGFQPERPRHRGRHVISAGDERQFKDLDVG